MEGNPTLVTSLEGLIKISSSEKPGIIATFTTFSLRGPYNRNYVWFLGTCQLVSNSSPEWILLSWKREKARETFIYSILCRQPG